MSFIEAPSFPLALSYGATGGPVYSTDLVQRSSGIESRNRNWRQPRCQWDVGSQHRTQAEVDELVQFFHAVAQGMEQCFRFRDFTDDTFANPIGTGDGTHDDVSTRQGLHLRRQSTTRTIVKPMAGGLAPVRGGGGAWRSMTPDFTTGLVTFWAPPAAGEEVSASGTFEVPTRFNQNVLAHNAGGAAMPTALDKIELVEVRLETLE